jgi:hypothetical protein
MDDTEHPEAESNFAVLFPLPIGPSLSILARHVDIGSECAMALVH